MTQRKDGRKKKNDWLSESVIDGVRSPPVAPVTLLLRDRPFWVADVSCRSFTNAEEEIEITQQHFLFLTFTALLL